MKRVLHIMGGMNRAGAETMIMNVYRTIDRSQIQFDFLVYKKERQDYEDEIEKLGGRVFHIPFSTNPPRLLKHLRALRKLIKEQKYCAIHIATLHNSAFALLASLGISKLKRIVHSHSTSNTIKASAFQKFYNSLTRGIINKLAEERIACGVEAGNYLFGEKRFSKGGIIINNSVDIDTFYNVNQDKVLEIKNHYHLNDCLVVGSVARLNQVKNHKKMIEIAEELKKRGIKSKLLIIGTGELENELKREVRDRNLEKEVLFFGLRTDIPELMHVMDVFLMPSIFEGNPVTLIEAQAAGLPALISDKITDKIDLGLGLIQKENIEEPAGKWVETLLTISPKTLGYTEIYNALSSHGYNLKESSVLLCNLYLS